MKKKLALLLACLMAVTMLAGCGKEQESTAGMGTSEKSNNVESAEGPTGSFGVDTQAIIDRGVLRVGVKNAVPGFGLQDTLTGEYSGMEIDIATKLAEYLGVEVEFTTVTAATRTELLDSGDIDCVLATFTITDERKESWDFSTPYYTDAVTVLFENASGIAAGHDAVCGGEDDKECG